MLDDLFRNAKRSDKSVWLGGYIDELKNEEVRSIDGLTEVRDVTTARAIECIMSVAFAFW